MTLADFIECTIVIEQGNRIDKLLNEFLFFILKDFEGQRLAEQLTHYLLIASGVNITAFC